MKTTLARLSVALCSILLWSTIAGASTMYDLYDYVGFYGGNDDTTTVEGIMSKYLGYDVSLDLNFYAKVESPSTVSSEGDGYLSVTYTGAPSDSLSGTWTTEDEISLISVKASNGYVLYWLDPALFTGIWDTYDISKNDNNPGMSHITTWILTGGDTPDPPGDNPVPEPGTMALLGIGLIGLAGISRKRYSN